MDYLWLIMPIAIFAVLAITLGIKLRSKTKNSADKVVGDTNLLPLAAKSTYVEQVQGFGLIIPHKFLPVTTQFDGKSMFEITDNTIVARISELIPFTSQTGTRILEKNAHSAIKGTEIVKLDIPFSRLTKSKDVVGAARGYVHGGKGVATQANLTKVDLTKVTKATTIANGVANVMNVGSMVVGQYYMSEISSKLETMTKSIDKIGDFQDREFKSRILSVLTLVGEISQFSSEIMEDDEQRNLKLVAIENLKATATELLGQVNITISNITQKTQKPDFKEYQFKINDFQTLLGYQIALITTIEEISKLTYLLGKGSISTERSYSTFNKYLEQSVQTRNLLRQWHDTQSNTLHIDLEKERITKVGFKAVVYAIPSLFDEKFKYSELSQNLVIELNNQIKNILERPCRTEANL